MLPQLSQDGLFRVQRHERRNRSRSAVLDEVLAPQEQQPWPHDAMSEHQVVGRLAHVGRALAEALFRYERRHRRRSESPVPRSPTAPDAPVAYGPMWTHTKKGAAVSTRVELYVDPVCPFAWIALRWLLEVEQGRELDLRCRLMSLAILNDGRPGHTPEIEKGTDSAWRPVRVGAALATRHGEPVLRDYLVAFGTRYHDQHVRGRDRVLREVLAGFGADELIDAADTTEHDPLVRRSHEDAVTPVGDQVGTPVVHVDGVAFFGPVLSAVPRAQAALDVFDGALLLARQPAFHELKRTFTGDLDFS